MKKTPLNINQAKASSLAELPGIGEGLANRILAYRKEVGPFRNINELAAVRGITDRMVGALKDKVHVAEFAPVVKQDGVEAKLMLTSRKPGSYAAHTVQLRLMRREWVGKEKAGAKPVWILSQYDQVLTADGRASLLLPPEKEIRDEVQVVVTAPDGEQLLVTELSVSSLAKGVELKVDPKAYLEVKPNTDPSFGRPQRLRGQVIDRAGQKKISNRQLVVWAAEKTNPQGKDFRALLVTQTDVSGHFSSIFPLGKFSAAHGSVSIGDEEMSVPIHLEKDGQFPGSMVLVVDLPEKEAQKEECPWAGLEPPRDPDNADLTRASGVFSDDLGTGSCVDFTKPDRTLEEFTFSHVIRTTEPKIKSVTLEEPAKVDLGSITHLLPQMSAMTITDHGASENDAQKKMMSALAPTAEGEKKPSITSAQVDARIVRTLAQDPDGFSLTNLASALQLSRQKDLERLLGKLIRVAPGREILDGQNPVDWDEDPTVYQACTIAHGHLLRFKQEWVADGYSMGNLLYSLPLAPAQKKQIAIVDWERREGTSRSESQEAFESLDSELTRDRDINEIVTGTLREDVRGGSSASTGSFGGGLGLGFIKGSVGGLLGIGGGTSSSSSDAWQNSSRDTTANSLQQLRDRTIQSASALRSQRATVVQSVRQGERMTVETETVANYNHCHAMTVQYFEVLRHLLVKQRLVDVQECLFVPLLMSRFDRAKALRWRDTMVPYVRDRKLRRGFAAMERIAASYQGSDLPNGTYADESLEHVSGELYLRFELARPKDESDEFHPINWVWLPFLIPSLSAIQFHKTFLNKQESKDKIFLEQLGPKIARNFAQMLQLSAVLENGSEVVLPMDPTLISDFKNDRRLYVTLNPADELPPITRKDIKYIKISNRNEEGVALEDLLPTGSRVIVESGNMRYRTNHHSGYLFRNSRIKNDLTTQDDVRLFTPLTHRELRNPKQEDKESARLLLDYLNEHIERFHHIIWWRMSPDRRYMLLDGFQAPGGIGRSVASVVDNELVGIVGNSLVMPVSRGFHLDPTFRQNKEKPVDLLEHYQPTTPIEPMRVAIPSKGVYAEAVMGACNSCEHKEEDRFWRWQEAPIPDNPPAIGTTSTDTRRSDPPEMAAKDYPAPIINLQNAPAAPDPAGVNAALSLLGKSDLFKDITGLEGNQKSALAALQSAMGTAQFFGGKAASLALQGAMQKDIDKTLRTITDAKKSGLIDDAQAKVLAQNAIQGMVGGSTKAGTSLASQPEVKKLLEKSAEGNKKTKVALERNEGGASEKVNISQSSSATPATGPGGAPTPTTIGKKSTKAEARAHIATTRVSQATSPWKIDRAAFLNRLEELVNKPELVDQAKLSLCGPAAFLRVWLARDPLAATEFACELYNTGKSKINGYKVEPDSDSLLAENYATLKETYKPGFTPVAEWMLMGSLRDAENFWNDYEGKPEEKVAAITTSGEVQEWLEATKLYRSVKDEGNFYITKGVNHALAQRPAPSRDVILLINGRILDEMDEKTGARKSSEFLLSAFPNHFIVLTAPIARLPGDLLKISCWSWGAHTTGTVAENIFEANYYGAVIAEG